MTTVALIAVLGVLSVGWLIVSAERDRAESIGALAEMRSLTSAYVEHVVLERAGQPADPDAIAAEMTRVVSAFRFGGDVGLAGSTEAVTMVAPHTSGQIADGLDRQQDLVDQLVVLGTIVRATDMDAAGWDRSIAAVRASADTLRTVIAETVAQMSAESEQANRTQLTTLLVVASIVFVGGVFAVGRIRRDSADGAARRYEALVQRSSDWVIVLDEDDRITYSTPAGRELLGAAVGELVGVELPALVHDAPDQAVDLASALASCRAGSENVTCTVEVRSDGRVRLMSVRLTDLRGVAGVEGIVVNARDVTEEADLTEELERLAYEDELTGLANRAMLVDHVHRSLSRAAREGRGPSLLHIDLDDFKIVNDAYGHLCGDELLCDVAARLLEATRSEDVVARLAGDEFAVLLDASASVEDVYALAERVSAAVTLPIVLSTGLRVQVTASMGIRCWSAGDLSPETFLRDADVAMYVAKVEGKGALRMFNAAMHEAVVERHELAQDLRVAIADGDLWAALQPKVDSVDGHIVGVEALARWNHPQLGFVSPGRFIPLAEDTGLIVDLGWWVLAEGARTAAALDITPGLEHVRVSVNVSTRQLADPSFVEGVASLMEQTGTDPRRMVLEITESALQADPDRCVEQLLMLRSLGFSISIDDFGTGASSLSRLAGFPLDELKIDRAFVVDGSGEDPRGRAMLRTIAGLGHELGLSVVAEGVETDAQLTAVREAGADVIQGFLYSRPVPLAELLLTWGLPSPEPANVASAAALRGRG